MDAAGRHVPALQAQGQGLGPAVSTAECSRSKRVAVLGSGVIGLTTALRLAESDSNVHITVLSDKATPDTTSDGAGGLWEPYQLGSTPPELVNRWGKETFDHYMSIYNSEDCELAGTILTTSYTMCPTEEPVPFWSKIAPHFRVMTPQEVSTLDPSGNNVWGFQFTTMIAEGRLYLPWLHSKLQARGVQFERRRIEILDEVAGFDVVVNCLGLGARDLFGDKSMYPIRGHVLRVRAPWVRNHVQIGGATYIIPNSDTVVLGGTTQKGDWDTRPRAEDRASILARTCAAVPSLRRATILREWVGLRPGRDSVRLEVEGISLQQKRLTVVHNYGHGGSGLTIGWGCAGDASRLVNAALAGRA